MQTGMEGARCHQGRWPLTLWTRSREQVNTRLTTCTPSLLLVAPHVFSPQVLVLQVNLRFFFIEKEFGDEAKRLRK